MGKSWKAASLSDSALQARSHNKIFRILVFQIFQNKFFEKIPNCKIFQLRFLDNLRTSSSFEEGASQKPPPQDALAHGLSQGEKGEPPPPKPKNSSKNGVISEALFLVSNFPQIIKNARFL